MSGPARHVIYKISPETAWVAAMAEGIFRGAPIDLADGYIHFSAAHQVRETAARHFTAQAGLVIVDVDSAALGDSLVWEPSRGGDLFPHLFGSLPMSAVCGVHPLPVGPDGVHIFPDHIP